MYSKIKFLGHPLHPMLVAFPIVLYTAALVGFVLYAWQGDVFWFRLGFVANIAGVVMALVAAVPGFLDWALGIPGEHEAKRVGTTHMALNVTALVLFALNAWLLWDQWTATVPNLKWALLLTALGTLVTVGAGYFGYELIQRHHVGVDLTPEQARYEPTSAEQTRSQGAYRRV